jgi:YNFM family putative membrane transporter
MFASPWAGQLADRFGRRRPLTGSLALMVAGSLITLSVSLPVVAIGILLVTIGFFGAHAVASGWVGRLAGDAKGHASSLYLLSYYMGSSFVGSAGGWFCRRMAGQGWSG